MSRFAAAAVLCLYQHRLMSTAQLRRLLCPQAGPRARYPQRQLANMRRRGLADAVARGRPGELLWFLTPAGAALAEQSGHVRPRSYRMTPSRAGGPLHQHTLAVAETGLAFVEAARRLGHECGPLDWIPEPHHRLSSAAPAPAGDALIPDALLNYVVADAAERRRAPLQFFLELDRATMTVARLAAKLAHYARYHDHVPPERGKSAAGGQPTWRSRYPRFPRVLIVLTGARETQLEARMADLAAHVHHTPQLRRHRAGFAAGVTTLHRLQTAGPFEPIFLPLLGDNPAPRDAYLAAAPPPEPGGGRTTGAARPVS